MTQELEPLFRSHPDASLRDVLESARNDGPSTEQLRSAAVALGIGATTVAAGAVATQSIAPAAKSGLTLIVLKWFGSGVIAGLVTAGSVSYVVGTGNDTAVSATQRPAPESEKPARAAAPAPTVVTPTTLATASADPAKVVAAPAGMEANEGAPLAAPSAEAVAAFADPAAQLRAETALLDQVRSALSSGAGSRALDLLDEYRQRFASPRLGPEATMLRARALIAAGRNAEARSFVQALLKRSPTHPHAQRLRHLVGLAPTPARNGVELSAGSTIPTSSATPASQAAPPTASF
ncbi:MAG: tetratricopeptide repeat protein [Polyangiaceae bacterium]